MDTQRFSYTSPKLELRSCPEKGGFGLFACQPIAAGELLAMWGGQVVTTEQLEELPVERQTHGIQVDEDLYLVPAVHGDRRLLQSFLRSQQRLNSPISLVAIRDKDYAASVIGVSPFKYKLLAFFTSSFFGGMSGAVLAFCFYRAVTPEQFGFNVSTQLVAMVLVGGLGSVIGAYLGAAFVLLTPMILSNGIAALSDAGWLSVSATSSRTCRS